MLINNFCSNYPRTWKTGGYFPFCNKLWGVSRWAVCQAGWNTWRLSKSQTRYGFHSGWL